MQDLQIGDGDMLALHVRDMSSRRAPPAAGQQHVARPPAAQQQQQQRGGGGGRPQQDPETLRLQILGDPASRANLARTHPDLALVVDNPAAFAQALRDLQDQERQHQARVWDNNARLNADPFDLDAQMRIEEMIREERVQENLQNAIEHNPEGWSCSSANFRMETEKC